MEGAQQRHWQLNGNNRGMLTDIFATRYADRPIWTALNEPERILLTQGWRIVVEQLMPYSREGKPDEFNKPRWANVESKLSMELGLEHLSPHTYGFYNASKLWISGTWSVDHVCKTWMLQPLKAGMDADRFIKERISFIELAFRDRIDALVTINANFDRSLSGTGSGMINSSTLNMKRSWEAGKAAVNKTYADSSDELNERFRRARASLNYHNGFIQIATDAMVQEQVEKPFWSLVSDPKWKNVEIDMAEAVDRRETAQRDPAFYAAKALESAIKVISDERRFTRGTEKNVNHYIDNLQSKNNGSYVAGWEAEAIRHIFANVRNELGHGPGGEPMPELTQQQTDWTIEAAMSWTKSLIRRL